MRFLSFLILICAALFLSSCITMIEHFRFNSDGSGTFSTTVDLSRVLENPIFGMALAEQLGEDPESFERIDTVFNMYEQLAPSNPQWTDEEKAFMQRINSRMELDFKTTQGGIYVDYDFKSVEELARMQTVMKNANPPEGNAGLATMGGDLGTASSIFEWGKGKMSRSTSISTDVSDQLGLDQDAQSMIANMYADARLIYIMEFPGRIKKVTGFEGSQNTGNSLSLEFPLLDMINSPSVIDQALDGSVKFKRR